VLGGEDVGLFAKNVMKGVGSIPTLPSPNFPNFQEALALRFNLVQFKLTPQ
jgi:hypothetical protein